MIGELNLNTFLKLAITKVGSLLLHNKLSQDENDQEIENINLVIPDYQRPYKWAAKNVSQLIDDIVDAKNRNKEIYRVGTLILHKDEEKSIYNIVDGQQRVITFSLLLKALGVDSIDFLEQSLPDNSNNIRNIPNNFHVLERRVNNFGDERDKKELLDYVINNCELIVVVTSDISEAFQFFDSQNSRGKKLYPHDLLKAYHLREMNDLELEETEKVVRSWEELNQKELSTLFSDYLYRVKEWAKGNKAWELSEHNIKTFKGITRQDNFPYAQFYKGAYAFADSINNSAMPFVSGIQTLKPFQLDTPIVAGKPFFDYAKHYYAILKDIQNNDKYEGYFINGNFIVKTLDLREYKNGVGNRITRLLFDTSVLLYVDRFCPDRPVKLDLDMLDQFVLFAFVWAYSLRAQYANLGWASAQNYIMGNEDKTNSFNIYKIINEADSPGDLLSVLADRLRPLLRKSIKSDLVKIKDRSEDGIYQNYLYHFEENNFLETANAI